MGGAIKTFAIEDLGTMHENDFCRLYEKGSLKPGSAFGTEYIGSAKTAREALLGALELCAASDEYDASSVESALRAEIDRASDESTVPNGGHDVYHYVSFRVC